VKNPHHPKTGTRIAVDPIREEKDLRAIKDMLTGRPRDLLLFTLGINNGLRTGDLLKLKVKDVRQLKAGQHITIRESKTGKDNILMVNKQVHRVLKDYLKEINPNDDNYLFASRKGGRPLTISSVNHLVKKWTRAINLNSGNYGAHSLRKTFGYHQRTKYGVGFEVLAKRFNHTSPAVTMRYLGLSSAEVTGVLMNEI
jgi:integrase